MTLFLDKEREHICWCPPGAAELVPDERYRLSVRSLVEVRDKTKEGRKKKRGNTKGTTTTLYVVPSVLLDLLCVGGFRDLCLADLFLFLFFSFGHQVVPGDSQHPRLLSLRAAGREKPLTFELDSDDLHDVVSKASLASCVCVMG